jgi:hypothetical protein
MVRVTDAGGADIMQGTHVAGGLTFAHIIVGMRRGTPQDPFGFASDIVSGTAVTIQGFLFNSSNTLIASTATVAATWEPLNGLGRLIAAETELVSATSSSAILAAVSRTYTTP